MASSGKKEENSQHRHRHHHPDVAVLDGNEEDVDKEWEDFTRLMAKLRDSRSNRPNRPSQAFYPCPPPKEDDQQEFDPFDYLNTIMYGRYTKDLGEFAKEEARKLKSHEKARRKLDKVRAEDLRKSRRGPVCRKAVALLAFIWKHTGARLGEDWVFLALLGIIMALISYAMDRGISMCNNARIWLYQDLTSHPALQYLAWVSLPVCLILFSAGFVHIVAPQSIGSGIPEMKTILRGVALKEYLTFRTLVAKVIGLTATLGSGLPLGKEGPFVHIASIVATLLSKLVTSFQGIYENESRNCEMLAAACAVGVASCFAAPIGGVLFSIEVTTVYFAVRNYWRGFFAAVCGATMFRLLAIWFQREETITAMFATNFTMDFPFDPQELFIFALIGVGSGLGGAFYVWLHRQYVIFMRKNKSMNLFLQKNRFLYPGIVSLMVASVSFPMGLGQFMAGELNTHNQVQGLFTNFTWTKSGLSVEEMSVVQHWSTPYSDVFVGLFAYALFTFVFSIICSTVPVPSGIFIPVFKIGAALGRAVGEAMALSFPNGVRYGRFNTPITPGGYATVGAAAFSAGVTHTISVSVIVFEMTGQITHIVPIMIAVLISNAIAALLQPSIYDSIILIKKLPYLPDLLPSSSGMYNIYVEDFMVRDVKYIYHGISYQKLKDTLKENRKLRGFPLVDNPASMILLGSIQRLELIKLIEKQIGRERRLQVAQKLHKEAEERAKEEMERQLRDPERTRRPSRFEVIPAPDILKMQRQSVSDLTNVDHHTFHTPCFGTQPKKSILKKTNSFTLKGFSPLVSPAMTPYTTVTGAESRIRLAFEAIFRKSATLQDVDPDPEVGTVNGTRRDSSDEANIPPHTPMLAPSPATSKKVQLPRERVIDMSPEDQKRWEESEMAADVDFSRCHIDPAPFQLVERTSLLKVHSLFSMVGVNHAYVTAIGRLVGVVALKELRKAIEDANSGIPPAHADINPTVSVSSLTKSDAETEILKDEDKLNSISIITDDKSKVDNV
ncbi:chloride channel protein 2 isoform X1 [Cotesia typhae]|uniref:chloride channel protein 2 isoform X1 n=1 Tax=Cotesia typhae TaxID=2053667 RepID=UPI003D682B62